MDPMPNTGACPCGSGQTYDACCGPVHRGERPAGTALALMRSRFTAFSVGDTPYLIKSWHPETRPPAVELDDSVTWRRLQIVDTEAGDTDDDEGVVEFRATCVRDGQHEVLHERSRFARVNGQWVYLDGEITD
jgi:SEC-C motif-containing protein